MKTAAKQRIDRKQRADMMARLRVMAAKIGSQGKLDILLSRVVDLDERRLMFNAIRPFLKFDAVYDEPAPPITRDEFAKLREKYAT